MSTPLRVVTTGAVPMTATPNPAAPAPAPAAQSLAERVRLLQAEARSLARDHVDNLHDSLLAVSHLAAEVAEGGEAYPPGVRELARRMVEENAARAATLEAILGRV
ncbi:hypothetical protein ACO2Q3_21265 [Caulobacter sp. KR2-114]|uniref:hypothetical protein n=1 Tax=Caulobacter sp. KR2-114 TaxID=3400912 RepID=UPI003C028248